MSQTAITFRPPTEMADALKTYAFATGRSMNEVITHAVADHLQREGRTETVRAAFEQVLADHAEALDKLKDL